MQNDITRRINYGIYEYIYSLPYTNVKLSPQAPGNLPAAIKAGSEPTNPENGQNYNANTIFGSGDEIGTGTYVIYQDGSAKGSVVIDNISTGIDYYFNVFEYSGTDDIINYNIGETTGFNVGNTGSTHLPIELLKFDLEVVTNQIRIEWSTASELNNDIFMIQRSPDTYSWETIDYVKGAGNSISILHYSTIDKEPLQGTNYYRIKQIDFDGAYSLSKVLHTDFDSKSNSELFVYPNPAKTYIHIQTDNRDEIKIFNTAGAQMNLNGLIRESQNSEIVVDINSFIPGLYIVTDGNNFSKLLKLK